MQVRNTMMFQSLDILNKNTDSDATMAQSVQHATATRKVPGSSLRHFLLFGQNAGTYATCERIGNKSEACVRKNAC